MSTIGKTDSFELNRGDDRQAAPRFSQDSNVLELLSQQHEVKAALNQQTGKSLPNLLIDGVDAKREKDISGHEKRDSVNESGGGKSEDQIVETQKNLSDSIGKISPQAASLFDKLSKVFEDRANAQGIEPAELLKTLKSLQEMVQAPDDSGAKMSQLNRAMVALDFMYHAADPSTIDQGMRDTCSASTIEEHMFVKQPSKVAELVAEVALTGKWKAGDGKTIEIDDASLLPGSEESSHPPSDGQRSLVSQIFQVTVLNDIAQRGELGGYLGQSVRYCENDGHSFVQIADDKQRGEFKGISVDVLQAELSRLTGESFPSVFINRERDGGIVKDVAHFDSPSDFQLGLCKMKEENRLPAIIGVYSNRPPFSDPEGGAHVLSITDIEKDNDGSYKVFVDNQWGKAETGAGADGWYSLDAIFNATKKS